MKKELSRRSGVQIAAELMKLLGGRLSAVMLLAVLNGSLGFLCAMGVPFFGAVGIAKALGESIPLSYGAIAALCVGCGVLRGGLRYLEQYGLREADIQSLPLRPESRAYLDCMIDAARNGEGEAECLMACLPCMLSYGWLFQKLLKRSPAVKDTYYGALVLDYASPGYDAACRAWAERAEAACTGLSPERAARCRAIFHDCSVHELHFWEMSAKPRTDL